MDRRRHRTRVIGKCDDQDRVPRAKRCDQDCLPCPSAYDVPWLRGDTGPQGPPGVTGPTGPSTFQVQTVNSFQPMLDEYSDVVVTFPTPFTNPATVLVSVSSLDAYFAERFENVFITSQSNTGFTARVKMVYGLRTQVVEDIANTVETYTSMILMINRCPMMLYCRNVGSDIGIFVNRNSSQDGSGLWSEVNVAAPNPQQPVISKLLLSTNGSPGFAWQVSGNFSIQYYGSTTFNGSAGSWLINTVFTPVSPTLTTSMAATILSVGVPAIVFGNVAGDLSATTIFIAISADSIGSSWNVFAMVGITGVCYVCALELQADYCPATILYNSTTLTYLSTTLISGTTNWTNTSTIEMSNIIERSSVALIILSNGLPAVFYKKTGVNGIICAVNSAYNGTGSWTLITILPSLVYFSSLHSLFPINLPNGNIGLMYTNGVTFNFAYASPSDLNTWQTNIVDNVLVGSGYSPAGVILNNGYVASASTSVSATDTIVFDRSAIKNELRVIDNTSYTLNWVATSP